LALRAFRLIVCLILCFPASRLPGVRRERPRIAPGCPSYDRFARAGPWRLVKSWFGFIGWASGCGIWRKHAGRNDGSLIFCQNSDTPPLYERSSS